MAESGVEVRGRLVHRQCPRPGRRQIMQGDEIKRVIGRLLGISLVLPVRAQWAMYPAAIRDQALEKAHVASVVDSG